MRKFNMLLIIALAAALLAGFASQAGTVSAQQVSPVGVVVAYVPGQSITIVDQHGIPYEFNISHDVKILPPGHASSLVVGSFVTIIAPSSLDHGKQTAVGIVIHPHVPGGWVIPTHSTTPLATATAVGTFTAMPTGTLIATDTATGTATVTVTAPATDTETATATPPVMETATDTPTATPTPAMGTTTATNTLIDWLASLFRQILTNR